MGNLRIRILATKTNFKVHKKQVNEHFLFNVHKITIISENYQCSLNIKFQTKQITHYTTDLQT